MPTSFKNNIAAQVVTDFLMELKAKDVDPEILCRIEKTILEEDKFSETALRAALFNGSEDD